MAQVANATGKVFVKAIVEPNGRISEVTLLRGFRPDCDAEALRVMRLFNAWKPAIKDGQPVRQAITHVVLFTANPPLFTKRLQANLIQQTVHYSLSGKIITGDRFDYPPTEYKYKLIMPVDTLGRVVGDAKVKANLRETLTMNNKTYPINRERLAATDSTGIRYQVSLRDDYCRPFGTVLTTDDDGRLCADAQHNAFRRRQRTFSASGMVNELREWVLDGERVSTWYPDGQLKQVQEIYTGYFRPGTDVVRLVAYWDTTGQSRVRDGQGERTWTERAKSRKDTTLYTQFVQHATYSAGLKNGLCNGAYADGSYRYEETYAKGVCQGGYALIVGRDTLRYTQATQNPTFAGGPAAVKKFASSAATYLTRSRQVDRLGIVRIDFRLDQTGTMLNRTITFDTNQLINDDALRLFDASKDLWQPAMLRGEPVRAKHAMVISFDLGQPYPILYF